MRLLRWLLRLYPAAVRRTHGEAMLETVETRLRLASGPLDRQLTLVREAVGLLAGALTESRRDPSSRRFDPPSRTLMQGFMQDLRYALRVALRDRGLTAVIVATLALGVGANVAIFSVVNSVLLRPLPYVDAGRLVRAEAGGTSVTKAIHEELGARMTSVDGLAAYSGWGVTVGGDEAPEVVSAGLVSSNYFDVLGVPPALGRTFVAADAEPGNDDVAVLSWDLWQRRFGGDESVVGRRVPIDNDHHSTRVVVGVLPRTHRSIEDWQLWIPYAVDRTDDADYFGSWYLQLVGRMSAGAEVTTVGVEFRERLATIAQDERFNIADPQKVENAYVAGLHEYAVGPVRQTLLVLLAAVSLVLVVACFNVANLLLARSHVRRRELGLRVAIGAARARLVRQLLTEALLLASLGTAVGTAGAWGGLALMRDGLEGVLPRVQAIEMDVRVLVYAGGAALVAALVFGTVPSLLLLRGGPGRALAGTRGSEVGDAPARLSRFLVAAEVALACVVVVGAGLMVRTLDSLWSVDRGFEADGVAVARAMAPSARYPEGADQRLFWEEAIGALNAMPGLERAAAIHLLPLQPGNWNFPFQFEDQVIEGEQPLPTANFRVVTPGYFDVMRIPLLQGRDFDERDEAGAAGAIIINQRMAEELWPGGSALGKRIDLFGSLETRVIGVVGNVRQHRLQTEPLMEMYRPAAQWPLASMVVVSRSADPTAALSTIQRAVHGVDPSVPVFGLTTMTEVMAESLSSTRAAVGLLSAFAGLALLLGAIGVYGVMSYVVTRRTRDIGIRMALGAPGRRVLRATVASAMKPVLAGLALGLVAALLTLRVMRNLLYGVEPTDPLTYAAVGAAIAGVGLLAAWLPARRAARVDPLRALRAE